MKVKIEKIYHVKLFMRCFCCSFFGFFQTRKMKKSVFSCCDDLGFFFRDSLNIHPFLLH